MGERLVAGQGDQQRGECEQLAAGGDRYQRRGEQMPVGRGDQQRGGGEGERLAVGWGDRWQEGASDWWRDGAMSSWLRGERGRTEQSGGKFAPLLSIRSPN